ncbi:UDP-N-acetylmuramyl tripeptide synthase [Acetomicrobium mobile DSM 13181]|uniref:UDP-N-acetylmuramyl tripeptide synthase n=3 Tax=Acetomicrobium TaxID=49894 RepID=I4BXI4_ACEMN|nr:Mur ligase family protein [Acetomicrobium mobile]AFM21991.1 UDP-N-acetylmuramyl tripeptide synthase [Acetomicrobium mobile DSM 13181]SIN76382.1 Mur ligase middle domain-containing protein [Acetomicrobium flavidum]
MKAKYRVLVTGTRGKSSLVRLMTAGFRSAGMACFSRITGVIPTELSPHGVRRIIRSREGHIKELQWWLSTVPPVADAIVAENSAVSEEFQPLAARWLEPNLVIWTNLREDHFEAWGPTKAGARMALFSGIPRKVAVILGPNMDDDKRLLELLKKNQNAIYFTQGNFSNFEDANVALAIQAFKILGLNVTKERIYAYLDDDPGRFKVLKAGNGVLAFAFAANDLESTVDLFASLGWDEKETSILFNNRRDRPGRLRAFEPWLRSERWDGVFICGAHPLRLIRGASWIYFKNKEEIVSFVGKRGLVFGCGNIAGLPILELLSCEEVKGNCSRI